MSSRAALVCCVLARCSRTLINVFALVSMFVSAAYSSFGVTEPILMEKLSTASHIDSVRVCRDRKTGSSLSYAYINFQQRADAERALDMFNLELLMGRPMRIMWSRRASSLRNSGIGNLFVKNLDKSIYSMALYDSFSVFEKVLSCKAIRRGRKGYVHFESAEAAERLNGKLFNDHQV